ncbi:hypothetical protein U1Q18_009145 [Sarracenia purpurea var. burkii]
MDPKALLDCVLFQLTPTRTRCDLVVVCGGISEKLASGLVEPFVSHLKFAKDQIPKGGYSITIPPPKTDASWFTKATIQRFVRFVSTPEVLERFARLEKEILQIESSVQSSEFANGDVAGQAGEGSLSSADGITKQSTNSSKLKGEIDGTDDAVQEENSKIRLQRLLETRKALLRKEQAMAYARALAAGFELDNIDDLIFFADAFGASRLREACTDFKELYKKKLTDGLWMDELAAMEACSQSDLSFLGTSGITLACESIPSCQNNGFFVGKLTSNCSLDNSSDSTASQANSDTNKDNHATASGQVPPTSAKVQVQMPWPPYMFNFQNPVQQMPPYQAYPYPLPPYYPGNMHWPQNMDESSHGLTRELDHPPHQRSSSSRKKEKSQNVEGPETSEEDEQTKSSDSEGITLQDRKNSSKEQPYKKKEGKKSSKTVVIRNINYITSTKRSEEKDSDSYDSSSSVEDKSVDQNFLRQKVEDVIGSFEKYHKTTSNNKRRSENKSSILVNGSNGSADQELENGQVTNISQGGKEKENWDAFQNLLMREKESTTKMVESSQPLDVLDEHFSLKSSIEADSFVVTERNYANEGSVNSEDFGNSESFRPSTKRIDCSEALLFPHRLAESRRILLETPSDCSEELSIIKNGKGEDWLVVNHVGMSKSQEATAKQMFDYGNALSSESDHSRMEKSKKIVPIDDSFMVQTQTSIDDQYDSHWKTDISMVSDLIVAQKSENGTSDSPSRNKIGISGAHEPDDLSAVLARDSGFESVAVSWSPELDYGVEASFTEAVKKLSVVETNNQTEENITVKSKSTDGKSSTNNSAKQLRSKVMQGSLAKSKYDVLSKSKKTFPTNKPMVQKSKLEKEEEARKRMEESLIQRQKRIAERTATNGFTPGASKKVPVASSPTYDKHGPQSTTRISTKLGSSNLAKNTLVPGQNKQSGGSTVSKSNQIKKASLKVIGVTNT